MNKETKFTKGEWHVKQTAPLNCAWTFNFKKMDLGFGIENEEFEADTNLIKTATKLYAMIETLIGNYQVAASIAEHEGYETNYEQDKILADFLLAEARGEL